MFRTLRAIQFLFMAPFILAFLAVINLMTSPGDWWIQWPALGLGIAWVINLLRVIRDLALAGGLAAIGYFLWKRYGADAHFDTDPATGEPVTLRTALSRIRL